MLLRPCSIVKTNIWNNYLFSGKRQTFWKQKKNMKHRLICKLAKHCESASPLLIRTSRVLLQIFSVQNFPAMADDNLQNFYYKFRELWSEGRRAHLQMECVNGRAWVNISTDLGPWRLPTHYSHRYPRSPRPRHPPKFPKPPGNPPPAPPTWSTNTSTTTTTNTTTTSPGAANGNSPSRTLPKNPNPYPN